MSRYIDADEFGRCLQNYRPYVDSGRFNAIQTEVNQVLDCIEYEIEDAPNIDIVRCKKCKYRKHRVDFQNDYCIQHSKVLYSTDGYCSWGERISE